MVQDAPGRQSGHVYILASPKTDLIKIGGTGSAPMKRIGEINASPYRNLGPWSLADFRQVTDWRKIEAHLHFTFRIFRHANVVGANELFRVAPQRVSATLNQLDPELILKRPTIDSSGIAGGVEAPTYADRYSGAWTHPTCSGCLH